MHIGSGPSYAEIEAGARLVIGEGEIFQLDEDIWIERLGKQLATRIQRACEPPHYGIGSGEDDRHLYAFVRRVRTSDKGYEGLGELHAVLALSRLVNPTTVGDRYCAHVFQVDVEESPIKAISPRGMSPDVLLSSRHRDWLSVGDAESLRNLMPWVSTEKRMHDRVHRAYWNHEYAMRSFYLDMRWPLVVSGLEALINVGKDDNKWQFRDRVGQLATEFKIVLTDTDLINAWDLRSKLVHGERFLYGLETVLPKDQQNDLYERLEELLRVTVRRCLLKEEFGDLFRDDAAVESNWPLGAKP